MKMMIFLTFSFTPTRGGEKKKVVAYGQIDPLPMTCVERGSYLDFGLDNIVFEVEDCSPAIIRRGRACVQVNCQEVILFERHPWEKVQQMLETFFLPNTLKFLDFEVVDVPDFDIRTLLTEDL